MTVYGIDGTFKQIEDFKFSSPVRNGDFNHETNEKQSSLGPIKLYKRRYVMMLIIFALNFMNGVPEFQYTVVSDIIQCYYNVTMSAVNWTSVIYNVIYVPLIFPVMYLMDTKGLKIAIILGGACNVLGSVIQCFTFTPSRFPVVLAAFTIYSFGQVLCISLPSYVAAVWFGANEVGLACAVGVFGNQIGMALGFIIPPFVMTGSCQDKETLTHQLSLLVYPQVAINIATLLAIIFVYQEKPKMFPSIAQALKKNEEPNYLAALKRFFKDGPFVMLMLAYGFLTGAYLSISTIVNEMVLQHFPGAHKAAGWMGSILPFAGIVGSVIFGVILDRIHIYKQLSVFVFVISFIIMIGYTFLIKLERIWIQYLFFTLFGLFATGYVPTGLDLGAEITYPESEAISGGLLNASMQLFSIIFIHSSTALIQKYGDFYSNIFFSVIIFMGTIFLVFMKCKLKRTNAANSEEKPQLRF